MTALLAKSNQNIDAAQKLIDAKLDASSIHCSYYSSLQRMYNILFEHFGEDEDYVINQCEEQGKSSHNFVIGEIKKELRNIGVDASVNQKFNNDLGTLKRNRVLADYHQVTIDDSKSKASLGFAKKINTILDNHFK